MMMTQVIEILIKIVYVGLDVPELGISTLPLLGFVIQGQRLLGLETNFKQEK